MQRIRKVILAEQLDLNDAARSMVANLRELCRGLTKTERVRATARYMGLVRHSRIIALVNENKLGLEIPDTPPVKLIPQDGDKE